MEHILLGRSPAMQELRRQLRALARAPFRSALVLGETGVGKERVALALAAELGVRLETFNCPAVPQDHLESELFGTTRGAYPGAVDRPGLAERADGGLLFLDEIGSMPAAHQAKLLRFVESGEARRLGASRGYRVRCSLLAASQEGLAAAVAEGRFRQDLYYRLVQDAVLRVPPLRERRSDLPVLARSFLEECPRAPTLGAGAAARLCAHDWPGNVRELRAVVMGAARLAGGPCLEADEIERSIERVAAPARPVGPGPAPTGFASATRELRRQLLVDALRRCQGNQTRAGLLLGLHGGGPAPDRRSRKLAHRMFRYWWQRLVESGRGAEIRRRSDPRRRRPPATAS